MTEVDPTAPPALFGHCLSVYHEMSRQAKFVKSEETTMLVYEGRLTDLICNDVGLSVPYYTKVTYALKSMGCARQLRRGGGPSPSQWELLEAPTLEVFLAHVEADSDDEPPPEYASAQQMRDLVKRVLDLEKAVGIR